MEQKHTHASKHEASVVAANSNGGESISANSCGGMTSAVSFRRPTPLPASYDGGPAVFPPTRMAGTSFHQPGWRILISAVASGGKSHVSPLGASARLEIAIFFGGGYFRQ
jgi:hypothetical protein